MTESTAVAKNENGVQQALESAPTKEAIEEIRERGSLAVAKRKELGKIYRQLEGLQWGKVNGRDFSEGTRMALSEIIYITKANPQLHIDVLGGKPYLNAQYWTDLANSHDHFIGYELRNLDLDHIEVLRTQANEVDKEANALKETGGDDFADEVRKLRLDGIRLRGEAREAERRRLHYGVPDIATAAYEVVVRRYRPGAPIERINAGEIDGDEYVQEIAEANWAPNSSNDPVGRDHPHNTARTRATRRGFVKAFSAWMEPLEEDVRRLESAIEAEYTVIRSDQKAERAALPSGNGDQAAHTGAGEPTAANAAEARPLPTREAPPEPEADEDTELRRMKGKFDLGLQIAGVTREQAIAATIEREPQTVEDYRALVVHLNGLADADEAEGEQGSLV